MKPRGAVFQPELIELMRTVLEEITATLPEAQRNPDALGKAAMSTIVPFSHYSHDISPARRVV